MKGFSLLLLLPALFFALPAAAQKRPLGYVDPAVLKKMERNKRETYETRLAMERSLTLLNNEQGLVPVQDVSPGRIAAVSIVPNAEYQAAKELKATRYNTFLDHVSNYTPASLYVVPNDTTTEVFGEVLASLEKTPMVIIGLHTSSGAWADNYGISPQSLLFIEQLSASHQVILAYFGNAQGLGNFEGYGPLVWAPSDSEAARSLSPQLIFGAFPARGQLPAGVGAVFEAGEGDSTQALNRLKYTVPEEFGINSPALDEIDSIVTDGIQAKAFPGAVVMAARAGKVFYWKAFGHHEYGMENTWLPMKRNDVFDLASITKVAATLAAAMNLQEEGKIGLEERFSTYVPAAAGTDKKDILIKEILTHQAGLIPFIRFWVPALENPEVFSVDSSASHPYRVAEGMYIQKDYFQEVMWKEML
ncbi:MAG TPA: serine hydrolase domain-containing protein, partial [Anseongella sp.]|nr:serine hydrolase domain-containing protein [Anseongella sp.]